MIWLIVIVALLVLLGVVGAMFLPRPQQQAARRYVVVAFMYIVGGLIYVAGFIGHVVVPVITRNMFIFAAVLLFCALAMFAGFALGAPWLTQAIAGAAVGVLFVLYLAMKAIAKKDGWIHGLSLGFGSVLVILASLALVQFGVGDMEAVPATYAIWGVYLFGSAWYVFNRMRGITGFFGLGCILTVGGVCLLIGILTRGFPVEAANLKSQYGLVKKSVAMNTITNNADISRKVVVVKSPVGKYTKNNGVASWIPFTGTSYSITPVMKDGVQESVTAGNYRLLDDNPIPVGTTGDTAIYVGKPNAYGEMASDPKNAFYIILVPGKVVLQGTNDSSGQNDPDISISLATATDNVWSDYSGNEPGNGGPKNLWMRSTGEVSFPFEVKDLKGSSLSFTITLSSELGPDLERKVNGSSEHSSDVTVLVNGVSAGTQNVIADDGVGKKYTFTIPASVVIVGSNKLTLKVDKEATHKNGMTVHTSISGRFL